MWYRLGRAAPEYHRFHQPFLWLVDFVKHLIGFFSCHEQVSLHDLKDDFCQWLTGLHGDDLSFKTWHKRYRNTDFRHAIIAHAKFLYWQMEQLDEGFEHHPLWSEVLPGWSENGRWIAVPDQPNKRIDTVVSPYVFESFRDFQFGKFLKSRTPVFRRYDTISGEWTIPSNQPVRTQSSARSLTRQDTDGRIPEVSIGDVVVFDLDEKAKRNNEDKEWFAYVQDVQIRKQKQVLWIIWLYRPTDTTCVNGLYPLCNELFLSDHCECQNPPIAVEEVCGKAAVTFFGSPDNDKTDYFVRQKYVSKDASFVSLQQSDFQCECRHSQAHASHDYEIGDTVLIGQALPSRRKVLEPVEIVNLSPKDAFGYFQVRVLARRARDFNMASAAPNELVYTHRLMNVLFKDINRRCHIRFFSVEDRDTGKIPEPYCCKGTADAFFICMQEGPIDEELAPLAIPYPSSLKQGFDPKQPIDLPKLRGMDLFCGGGSFGRGLEEGCAVEHKWAIDWDTPAIHTYRANLASPEQTALYHGSVDEYLAQAMKGKTNRLIAQPGEVDFISAGSPCQGFSNANKNKSSEKSLRNCSKIASVVSYIDFYRPKYALLENVSGVSSSKNNVLAQIICALVGMGYQTRQCFLHAGTYGSPQTRARVFILIAAPGLTPLSEPPHSHSYPPNSSERSLGKTKDLAIIAPRCEYVTPFKYCTAAEAIDDLPHNSDARDISIPFPDHRPSSLGNEQHEKQLRTSCIPRYPRCQTLALANAKDLVPRALLKNEAFLNNTERSNPEKSRSWKRIDPEAAIPCVTTAICPDDSRIGQWVHWDHDRCLTVMEARRAQGIPDHEVLIGSPAQQWKIVGNSVARQVALAFGMSLRAAWLKNHSMLPTVTLPHSEEAKKQARTSKVGIRGLVASSPSSIKEYRDVKRKKSSQRLLIQNTISLQKQRPDSGERLNHNTPRDRLLPSIARVSEDLSVQHRSRTEEAQDTPDEADELAVSNLIVISSDSETDVKGQSHSNLADSHINRRLTMPSKRVSNILTSASTAPKKKRRHTSSTPCLTSEVKAKRQKTLLLEDSDSESNCSSTDTLQQANVAASLQRTRRKLVQAKYVTNLASRKTPFQRLSVENKSTVYIIDESE